MEEKMSDGVPQFTTAEYSGSANNTACKSCGQPISGAYYQVNGALTCSACAQQIKDQMLKDSHAAFARGVLFGSAAAVLGLVLYVTVALTTGLIIGFVSLAVGYMVGKAIIMGSGGLGGRRYQIAAVILTYIAVSLSAVPIAIAQHMKPSGAQQTQQQKAQQEKAQGSDSAAARAPKMSPAKVVATLAFLGLASPFLDLADPAHGIIGLIILFVGIRIAWQLTAGRSVKVLGPINERAPATPG
jgi:hypothetical protein